MRIGIDPAALLFRGFLNPATGEVRARALKGKTMKIREIRTETGFGGNETAWERVRTLRDGEPLPAGAEQVDDTTPEHEWDLRTNRSGKAPTAPGE